jgi:hypothetical protein
LQLHGIPEWIAPAGPRLGRGSWHLRKNNFQTSSYSTPLFLVICEFGPLECADLHLSVR